MKTYKVLSLLLSYPRQDWVDHVEEFKPVLVEEKLLSKAKVKGLNDLIDHIQSTDLIKLQEQYVATFDRGPAHSLHLFEHIHGESRDRGQAMVDLMEMYSANGFGMGTSELPDYLPVFLEFLSSGSVQEASAVLGETKKVLTLIKERLSKKKIDYKHVFAALTEMADGKVNRKEIKQMVAQEKDEVTFEDIDNQWVEPEAFGKNPFKSRNYLNQKIKVNINESKGTPQFSGTPTGGLS